MPVGSARIPQSSNYFFFQSTQQVTVLTQQLKVCTAATVDKFIVPSTHALIEAKQTGGANFAAMVDDAR